jgi:TolA-binding protein
MNRIFLVCGAILLFAVNVGHAEEQPILPIAAPVAGQVEEQAVTQSEIQVEEQLEEQVVTQVDEQVEVQEEQKVPFWIKLRTRIEKMTPQKKPSITTAVGGVRGAKSEAGRELYWKGEEVEPKFISEQELAQFDEALKKVEEGDNDTARQLFEDFMTEFPESGLKSEALFAIGEIEQIADK